MSEFDDTVDADETAGQWSHLYGTADDLAEWSAHQAAAMRALRNEGFSRKDALALMTRPLFTVNAPPSASAPPEMTEFMSRMTAWLNKEMAE